jgi:KDO2-lipid IV(A) lauroyltransferase
MLLGAFRLLPLKSAMGLAGSVSAVLGPYSRRADRVRENLAVAFPDTSSKELECLMRASFRHVGVAIAELTRLDQIWRERDKRIEFVVQPGAPTPAPERRTVFVTAHVGAWQVVPLVAPRYGLTVPIIFSPEKNPFVARRLAKLRGAFGCPLVASGGGIRVLMHALDEGQSIGLTVDTRLDAGEPLPFFGEDAPTNTAPARLALRYGCDLVPVRAERLADARYRVNICAPIQPRDPHAAVAEQARDMTRQINALFETWIRAKPGEWVCMKRRWPKEICKRRC